ncbi:MAG TPA: hypothetical protein VEF04_04255 [Blastocatellia bacterium]|nr:hypothetical protein [Blastocatellia bacterium]
MSNGLGLSPATEGYQPSQKISSAYVEAINAARFVKGFGITAMIFSMLLFGGSLLSVAVGLGIGLFILRYDKQSFYRVLGITVMVLAILLPINFLSSLVLSGSVMRKGILTLRTLSRQSSEDDDWIVSKKRAMIGTICSGLGIAVFLLYLLIFAVSVTLMTLRQIR